MGKDLDSRYCFELQCRGYSLFLPFPWLKYHGFFQKITYNTPIDNYDRALNWTLKIFGNLIRKQCFTVRFIERQVISEMFHNFVFSCVLCVLCCAVPCRVFAVCCVVVDGYWHEWSNWTSCNVSCGGGSIWRRRRCEQPLFGGENCTGPSVELQDCNTFPCPGIIPFH